MVWPYADARGGISRQPRGPERDDNGDGGSVSRGAASLAGRWLVQSDEHVHHVDGVRQGLSDERRRHAKGTVGEQRSGHAVLRTVDSRRRLHHDRRHRDRRGGGGVRSTVLRAVGDDRGNDRDATHSRQCHVRRDWLVVRDRPAQSMVTARFSIRGRASADEDVAIGSTTRSERGQGVDRSTQDVQAATDGREAHLGWTARSRARDDDVEALRHRTGDAQRVRVRRRGAAHHRPRQEPLDPRTGTKGGAIFCRLESVAW